MFRPAVRRTLLDRALLVVFVLFAVAVGAVGYRDCKAGRVTPSSFWPSEPPK